MARSSLGGVLAALLCVGGAILACNCGCAGRPAFVAAPSRTAPGRHTGPSRVIARQRMGGHEVATLPEVINAPPAYEEEAIAAIEECISQGPSVESLAKLDVKLRSVEQQLELAIQQQADSGAMAHLVQVRQRVSTLRGQMEALQGVVAYILYNPEDESLGQQLVKVASDAFSLGGARRGEALAVGA